MLLPFFQWMQESPASMYILSTTWFSPIVQVMHLTALAIFAGSILIVDLRLIGVGVTATPLAQVARDARPWFFWGLIALFITGMPSVASTAMKQYFSPFFWWKMELLMLGLVFTYTIRQKFVNNDASGELSPIWPKVAGMFSIAVWTGVAIGARLIGLLS